MLYEVITIGRIKACDPEHLSCTLAVRTCDQRGVKIIKTLVEIKGVNGLGHPGSDPEGSTVFVGPGPKVGNAAQKLVCMPFFLQRIIIRCNADHIHGRGLV